MTAFDFRPASTVERAARRKDAHGCTEALRACKPLADRLAASPAGIYSELSEADEAALQALHWVCDAHESPIGQYDGAFDLLRAHAGLLPSDVGLLTGRLHTLYQERQPEEYRAMVEASLRHLLSRGERPTDLL